MATLSVWKFDSTDGAERAEELLLELQEQDLIRVHDGATVSWEPGKKGPKTRQLDSLTGAGALGGAFWGLLFGLLFLVPLLGAAVGAAAGGLMGSMSNVGIDDDFLALVKSKVTPGTSALFVVTALAVPARVVAAFHEAGLAPELIATDLSEEEEAHLREVLDS